MEIKTLIRLERQIWTDDIAFHLAKVLERGGSSIAQPVAFVDRQRGQEVPYVPFMSLSQTEAQLLMDELWHVGIRPSEGTGSAGSLAATERHLKDMQQIAFTLLKPPA